MHISMCHLITQAMASIFDEFQFMVHKTKFNITLSEMWLKDKKHLLGYGNLPGYNFSYRNRNEKKVVVLEYV